MADTHPADTWLTVADCARRTGLTVRALRVYEARGLIVPHRTHKAWRLYGPDQIARLHALVALKSLGFSLARIATLLNDQPADLDRTLALQHATLLDLRDRVDRSLGLVGAARAKHAAGQPLSTDDLITLVKETSMDTQTTDLVAQRRYEQARPRSEISLDPALMDPLVGHYLLEGGSVVTISRDGDQGFLQISGQPPVPMYPESPQAFFLKIQPAQITFTTDGAGAVTGLVLHQSGFDHPAARIDAAEAHAASEALQQRIASRSPMAGSEAALRRLLEEQRQGQPDYDRMSEALAMAVRQQLPIVQPELTRLGDIRSVAFKEVSARGADAFLVTFDKGEAEWRIRLGGDGKVHGLALINTRG